MYAFNKRFRPTLHLGMFTITTLALGMFGSLLFVFSVGCFVQIGNKPLGVVLFFGALIAFFVAIRDHLNQSRARVLPSIWRGKREKNAKRLELING